MTYGYGRSLSPRQRRGQPSRNPAVSRTRVSLAGREVALWQLRRAAGDYRALVEKANVTDGCAWCLCTDPSPRLVIRHREGIYYLACWPGGGQAHARGCEFRNTGGQWSGRGYYQAARCRRPTTVPRAWRCHFRCTSARRTPQQRASPQPRDAGTARSRMGLLGLLHYLWERANLTRFTPDEGRRRTGAGGPVPALSCGEPSPESARRVCRCPGAAMWSHRSTQPTLTSTMSRSRGSPTALGSATDGAAGLMLGAVRSWTPTRYGQRCDLRHHRTPVFFSTALHERIRRAAPSAMTDQRPAGSEQVVLALVSRSEKGNLSAVGAAVMLTNAGFVPADSTHEVVMADALTAAKRSFVKPLRYDGDAAVLPDFVLTDTDPATMVEVWGCSTATTIAPASGPRSSTTAAQTPR